MTDHPSPITHHRSKKLWLIGGTSDSAEIALVLSALPMVVTVTTETARQLYPVDVQVSVGKMQESELTHWVQKEEIVGIIDASHPYATVISANAIALSEKYQIPYLRYERPQCPPTASQDIIYLDSFQTLLTGNYLQNQRVLLTVGCKVLPEFQPLQNQDNITLFTRILPIASSVKIAQDSGFSSDRIIAIRPPISAALEAALWQQWEITLVVTKASGKAGGEDIKQQVSQKLGIPLIVIQRPSIAYPRQTDQIQNVIEWSQFVYSRS